MEVHSLKIFFPVNIVNTDHGFFFFYLTIFYLLFTGPPDPNKTVFVRQSSTVVCTAGVAHSMTIEPRDEYDNLCVFANGEDPTDGYHVNITQAS